MLYQLPLETELVVNCSKLNIYKTFAFDWRVCLQTALLYFALMYFTPEWSG